jgi:hypothetical protein
MQPDKKKLKDKIEGIENDLGEDLNICAKPLLDEYYMLRKTFEYNEQLQDYNDLYKKIE